MLRYVDYSYYGVVLAILILAVFLQGILLMLVQLLWFFSTWAIALMNCFSMRRINSELHQVNNIRTNKKFMALYVGIFFTAAVVSLVLGPLEYSENVQEDPTNDGYYRFEIAYASFQIVLAFLFLGLHLLMLHMIVKFDRRLSPEMKVQITDRLRQAFARGEFLEESLSLKDGEL